MTDPFHQPHGLYTTGVHFKPVFTIGAPGTTGVSDNPWQIIVRYMCVRLLYQIPDEGLPELLETLERIREHYTTVFKGPSFQPKVETKPAKTGASYERPAFHLDEE